MAEFSALYQIIKAAVRLFYPKMEVVGTENLLDEAAIIVGNHTQMNGPIACELYFHGERYIWRAGQMMYLKEVPAYVYQDYHTGQRKKGNNHAKNEHFSYAGRELYSVSQCDADIAAPQQSGLLF